MCVDSSPRSLWGHSQKRDQSEINQGLGRFLCFFPSGHWPGNSASHRIGCQTSFAPEPAAPQTNWHGNRCQRSIFCTSYIILHNLTSSWIMIRTLEPFAAASLYRPWPFVSSASELNHLRSVARVDLWRDAVCDQAACHPSDICSFLDVLAPSYSDISEY